MRIMKKLLLVLMLATTAIAIHAMDNDDSLAYKLPQEKPYISKSKAVAARKAAEAAALLLKETFFTAVENGNLATVQQLLEENPLLLNQQARQMKTPLMLAAHKNQPVIAKFLLNAGADIEARGFRGRTALIVAADKGHLKILNLLLEADAYVNAQNDQGLTALMVAKQSRRHTIVERLCLAGATTPEVQSSKSKPSLKRARPEGQITNDTPAKKQVAASTSMSSNDDYLDFLCDFLSADLDTPVDESVDESQKTTSPSSETTTETIVDNDDNLKENYSPSVEQRVSKSTSKRKALAARRTAEAAAILLNKTFFTAVENGNLATVQQLLEENPFLLNQQARQMKTPLMLAAHKNQPVIAKFLLDAGADIEIRGYRDRTALIVAADKGHLEILNLLLEARADINAQNNQGFTALRVAENSHHLTIVERLRLAGATTPEVQSSKSKPSIKRIRPEGLETNDTLVKERFSANPSMSSNDDYLDILCYFLNTDLDTSVDEPVDESQKTTHPNSETTGDNIDDLNNDWIDDFLNIDVETL